MREGEQYRGGRSLVQQENEDEKDRTKMEKALINTM